MKLRWNFLCPLNRNVIGQITVGAAHPRAHVALKGCVKVHHLHQTMNACIGAARAQGGDFLGGEFFEGFFQFVLDGEARALALPALIGLTVVGDAQSDSHWRVSVLARDLTLPKLVLAWGVKSKLKSSAAMLAGISNLAL